MHKYNRSLALSKQHYPYQGSYKRQKMFKSEMIEWESSYGMKYTETHIQVSGFDSSQLSKKAVQ